MIIIIIIIIIVVAVVVVVVVVVIIIIIIIIIIIRNCPFDVIGTLLGQIKQCISFVDEYIVRSNKTVYFIRR